MSRLPGVCREAKCLSSIPVLYLRQAWLHSSNPSARWNHVGDDCDGQVLFASGRGRATYGEPASAIESNDPFELLDWMADHPRDGYRWIGYLGYGLSRFIERLPSHAINDLGLPLLAFGRFRHADRTSEPIRTESGPSAPLFCRTIASDDYQQSIRRVLEYIAAGDVFQVNLAQRLCVRSVRPAQAVWSRLLRDHPAYFGALLDFGSFSIVSNSPELFFRIEPNQMGERRIVNRPIKGTRPRGLGMLEELKHSEKDIAELAMIVDLQRNDLGRVCQIGSVQVTCAREIETHPTVYHGVATIEGMLRREAKFSDVLKAMFPCGSITGCPKIRAMEIIDELEPFERGPYCGAIGYLNPDGMMEFNVAIRTMTIKDGAAHLSVGGGIVADSTPAGEYDETLVKASAMLDALGVDVSAIR